MTPVSPFGGKVVDMAQWIFEKRKKSILESNA